MWSVLLPMDDLDELLPQADALVLSCPLTPSTYRLLDARRIALLKPSAIVVNVARGQVVEEAALLAALRGGRLRGAALDVFEEEPLPAESPFWDLPNVLVSPHSASTVAVENDRIVGAVLREPAPLPRGRAAPERSRQGASLLSAGCARTRIDSSSSGSRPR